MIPPAPRLARRGLSRGKVLPDKPGSVGQEVKRQRSRGRERASAARPRGSRFPTRWGRRPPSATFGPESARASAGPACGAPWCRSGSPHCGDPDDAGRTETRRRARGPGTGAWSRRRNCGGAGCGGSDPARRLRGGRLSRARASPSGPRRTRATARPAPEAPTTRRARGRRLSVTLFIVHVCTQEVAAGRGRKNKSCLIL